MCLQIRITFKSGLIQKKSVVILINNILHTHHLLKTEQMFVWLNYTNICSECQGNIVLYFILTGTPIRIKYRMTLKNNVNPIIAADTLLYSLFYQFIFFLITHKFKVFKETTDVIIDYVFCLFF